LALVLRCQRRGRRNRPFFRVVAADERAKNDGRVVENLGYYDPLARDDAKRLVLNAERAQYWLGVGAQVTETVASLLAQRGVALPVRKRRKRNRPSGKIGVGGGKKAARAASRAAKGKPPEAKKPARKPRKKVQAKDKKAGA
jgi:small subunit ribosomal protein S16